MPEESMLVDRWMHGLQALQSQVVLEDEGCDDVELRCDVRGRYRGHHTSRLEGSRQVR